MSSSEESYITSMRQYKSEAVALEEEAREALGDFHNDLISASPDAYDGIVYFDIDTYHTNNANPLAAIYPDHTTSGEFYERSIRGRRIDLAATALGASLERPRAEYRVSRMNTKSHLTSAIPVFVDKQPVGAAQIAFRYNMGKIPSQRTMEQLADKYALQVRDIAHEAHVLSKKVTSMGDTLELLPPVTPNAYVVSWDVDRSSSTIALGKYGMMRNFLFDTKAVFTETVRQHGGEYRDIGDGQDAAIWLPEHVDRSNPRSIQAFGRSAVLPLINKMVTHNKALNDAWYSDYPVNIELATGLGYLERDKYGAYTGPELWDVANLHKDTTMSTVKYTKSARNLFTI